MRQGWLLLVAASISSIATTSEAFVVPATSTFGIKYCRQQLSLESTRRESFGDLLGSALLPVAATAAVTSTVPQVADAEDDYPFKVGDIRKQLKCHFGCFDIKLY
jgi:hypothetical protein